MTLSGFDDLSNMLDDLDKRARELDGEHAVPIEDILTPAFVSSCSEFASIDAFFGAGGFSFESQEEFERIPDEELDSHVRATTTYEDWDEMLTAAGEQYALRQLGF